MIPTALIHTMFTARSRQPLSHHTGMTVTVV